MAMPDTSRRAFRKQVVLPSAAERFRCPEDLLTFEVCGELSAEPGFFRFGPEILCYGRSSVGTPARKSTDPLVDVRPYVRSLGTTVELPFDPQEVVDNILRERYVASMTGGGFLPARALSKLYYLVRPLLPVAVRKQIQRLYFSGWREGVFPAWPVDRTVDSLLEELVALAMKARNLEKIPFIWFWPDGAPSCTMVTHDVETLAGVEFCPQLMDLNDSFGIKTAFQIVPERRYPVTPEFLAGIRARGFEINVHDLNHDGRLFIDREEFLRRAPILNQYGRTFQAAGFRSAVLYRNVDWFDALEFSYDMSVPTVARLDPQPGGCCTVLPYFIGRILELPVTAAQDYALYHLLNDYTIELWKRQIALIREKHGLISIIVHPDYVIEQRARKTYVQLLEYLSALRQGGQTWIAQPRNINDWWRLRSRMTLAAGGGVVTVHGEGSERARVGYLRLGTEGLRYEVA